MQDNKEILLKAYVVYVAVALVMLGVIVRVVMIQYGDVVPNSSLVEQFNEEHGGDQMPTKMDTIVPMRGRILASDRKSDLVSSIPLYDLHMDLSVVSKDLFDDEVDSLAECLAEVFENKTKREWLASLSSARQDTNMYFLLQRNVQYDVLAEVREFPILREKKYKGGFIEEKYFKRQVSYGLLAQRTLGYKREGARPVGLEGAFDSYLTGEHGLKMKRWVNNGWKPVGSDFVKEPIEGADVITSIDVNIQEVAESELMRQLVEQDAAYGSVVLMEVETGYIKAIANLTKGQDGGYYELYNHAVGTKTDPGSTFKLASLMALLEDGLVDIDDIVGAYGVYRFYDAKIEDSNHGNGYGQITVQEAFEKSSNVFSKIINDAYQSNPQKYIDRLKSFGLADTLGLDIAGEPFPTLKNVGEDGWSGITLPWMAIGYEVELTPIQILAFYNAVANDGELIKPQFVTEIRRRGELVKEFDKVVINERICSEETIEKLKVCLEGVVEKGTGKKLQSANFSIAGKTGTAKLINANNEYGKDYQASFVGYFPANDPKYSCIVSIAGPTKQIYGAEVSGTVFKAIADKVYSSSPEYHPNFNLVTAIDKETSPKVKYGMAKETFIVLRGIGAEYRDDSQGVEWVVAQNSDVGVDIKPRSVERGIVPNVVGMVPNDAIYLLENFGLRVKLTGSGKVVSQSQSPGTELIKGTQIILKLN